MCSGPNSSQDCALKDIVFAWCLQGNKKKMRKTYLEREECNVGATTMGHSMVAVNRNSEEDFNMGVGLYVQYMKFFSNSWCNYESLLQPGASLDYIIWSAHANCCRKALWVVLQVQGNFGFMLPNNRSPCCLVNTFWNWGVFLKQFVIRCVTLWFNGDNNNIENLSLACPGN